MTYHGVDAQGIYRVGAMMLDLKDPRNVIARAARADPCRRKRNTNGRGLYPHGVVFPTANVVLDGKLFVYYGCADKYIGVATADFDQIVHYVLQFPA